MDDQDNSKTGIVERGIFTHYICCSSPLDSYSRYKILLMNERVNAETDSFHSYLPAASLMGQVRSLEVPNKNIFLFFFEVRCIIKVGTGEFRSPILKYVFCFSLGLGASLRMIRKEEAGGDF